MPIGNTAVRGLWTELMGIARMQGFQSIRVIGTDIHTGRIMEWFKILQ